MWEINSQNQLITFLLSLCLGAIFCLIYDIIRAVRRVCHTSLFAITVGDMVLWIVYAFVTFIFLISRTNGEIRAYVLVGEFLGFVLFRISFSRIVFAFLYFVFFKLSIVKQKIYRLTDMFYAKFDLLVLKIIKYLSKIFKRIKKGLKNIFKLLYTKQNNAKMEKSFDETKTKA